MCTKSITATDTAREALAARLERLARLVRVTDVSDAARYEDACRELGPWASHFGDLLGLRAYPHPRYERKDA